MPSSFAKADSGESLQALHLLARSSFSAPQRGHRVVCGFGIVGLSSWPHDSCGNHRLLFEPRQTADAENHRKETVDLVVSTTVGALGRRELHIESWPILRVREHPAVEHVFTPWTVLCRRLQLLRRTSFALGREAKWWTLVFHSVTFSLSVVSLTSHAPLVQYGITRGLISAFLLVLSSGELRTTRRKRDKLV
jgi:hypothetical protein